MANLRIIYNNAGDRATLSSSSAAGALVVDNLKSDLKSVVWRSSTAAAGAAPTARIDAAWSGAETIAGVALAYCNLTTQASMRVRGTKEVAATNRLPYSDQFDNNAWGKSGASVAVNVATSPDGTANADKLVDSTASGTHLVSQSVTLPAGTCTFSVFAKAAEYDMLDLNLAVGANRDTVFDLASGTVYSKDASVVAGIMPAGGGWYRCTLTTTAAAGTGPLYMILYKRNTGINFAGTGAAGVLIWGAQLEDGAAATSYYPTGSGTATRPVGYMDGWQSYDLDSGWMSPCPATTQAPAVALGANAFAYGAASTARAWLPAPAAVRALRIEITDAGNPGGYIEASRLVCGGYWEPTYNAEYGASVQPVDSSKNFRNDAGDLMSDVGTRNDKLSISMSTLTPVDRAVLLRILRGSGVTRPVFISLFPNHGDPLLEQDHQLVGKLVETPAMSLPSYNIAAATLQIESI